MNYVLQFSEVFKRADMLLVGVLNTGLVALLSIVLGSAIGIVCATVKTSFKGQRSLTRVFASVYVEFFRNTPFLAQLLFLAFGLPQLFMYFGVQIRPHPLALAVLALGINLGAYMTEIIRAGLESVPRAQIEAAQSLAMKWHQIFLKVILPPAIMNVYPSIVSQLTLHTLGTSIVSAIAVQELTYMSSRIQAETFRTFETYIVVAVIYFALALATKAVLRIAFSHKRWFSKKRKLRV